MFECIKTTKCNEGDFLWKEGKVYISYYEDPHTVAIYGFKGGYLVFSKDKNNYNYYGHIFKRI